MNAQESLAGHCTLVSWIRFYSVQISTPHTDLLDEVALSCPLHSAAMNKHRVAGLFMQQSTLARLHRQDVNQTTLCSGL